MQNAERITNSNNTKYKEMKKSYTITAKHLVVSVLFLLSGIMNSQEVHFTFANAINSNDGADDFYEVDVMIQTINASGTFKLGSGQLYFNYNTGAFGPNISTAGSFEATYPEVEGYVCGQVIDNPAAPLAIYTGFTDNDNLMSRVSWNFSQAYSSSTFADDNITDTPKKLVHLKIKYADISEEPMLTFEDGGAFDDQFFTACGSAAPDTGFNTADCTGFPGVQLTMDTFDSTGATLSDKDFEIAFDFSIYPNPASDIINIKSISTIDTIEMFDLLGKQVLVTEQTEQIKVNDLPSGVYLLKVYSDKGNMTKKVVIE